MCGTWRSVRAIFGLVAFFFWIFLKKNEAKHVYSDLFDCYKAKVAAIECKGC